MPVVLRQYECVSKSTHFPPFRAKHFSTNWARKRTGSSPEAHRGRPRKVSRKTCRSSHIPPIIRFFQSCWKETFSLNSRTMGIFPGNEWEGLEMQIPELWLTIIIPYWDQFLLAYSPRFFKKTTKKKRLMPSWIWTFVLTLNSFRLKYFQSKKLSPLTLYLHQEKSIEYAWSIPVMPHYTDLYSWSLSGYTGAVEGQLLLLKVTLSIRSSPFISFLLFQRWLN